MANSLSSSVAKGVRAHCGIGPANGVRCISGHQMNLLQIYGRPQVFHALTRADPANLGATDKEPAQRQPASASAGCLPLAKYVTFRDRNDLDPLAPG